ncbi:hypothetical protein M3557_04305 [Bhargavaea ginsengi]|uniref:DUF5659 domain-containing protein n=1 Tax=Bhargavaea ginsengi TaxID=426757 RepID=UPI0020420353|nr:DUF5659 domain-containing protein [Bhargavaea ginsengi]MCM3087130.1 hypothetical protein [Bhargavaea ginsengi]
MTQETRYKCVRSLRIARELMAQGFRPVDVEQSRRNPKYLVFVFDETAEFAEALTEIITNRRNVRDI